MAHPVPANLCCLERGCESAAPHASVARIAARDTANARSANAERHAAARERSLASSADLDVSALDDSIRHESICLAGLSVRVARISRDAADHVR